MLDAPCGDLNWMIKVIDQIDIQYLGADIVEEIIITNSKKYNRENMKFILLDLTDDQMPHTDMLFCRDCLFHLSFADTKKVLKNFLKSKTEFLFTTTYDKDNAWENEDILTGYFRAIDLHKKPYFFPKEPIYSVLDGKPDNTERFMKIWSREQVKSAYKNMKL